MQGLETPKQHVQVELIKLVDIRGTAHAYSMRKRNDQDGQNMVVSKFHLFGSCVLTLFGTCSTHLCICSSLVLPKNVKYMILNYDVLVESPLSYQVVFYCFIVIVPS